MHRFEAAEKLRERREGTGWILALAGVTTAVNCIFPCWQIGVIALLSVALWADENWEVYCDKDC